MSVSFSAVPSNAVASGVFIEQEYKRTGPAGPIPQRVAVLGQYNTGKTPTNNQAQAITSADEAASLYGRGSMLHRMARRLFAGIGAGTVLVDAVPLAPGVGTAAGTITVTGSSTSAGTLALYVGGERVAVAIANSTTEDDIAAAIAAAINANLDLPVTAGVVDNVVTLTARHAGLAGNQITVRKDIQSGDAGLEPTGPTVVIVALSGGTTDPDITTALANFGGTWYTWVVCPYNADASLDILEAAGVARIDPSVKRPFAGVVGYADTRANFLTWLDSRNSPWTTAVPVDSSPDHPAEIAAAAVGSCALSAQSEPARPFKTLALPGITAGNVAPWTYAQRNAVEAAGGSSTYLGADGVVRIHDLVTTYVTNALGAVDESWRFTVTITNVQAKIYSLDQLFLSAPFDRAVVVDDNAVTSKAFAVSPKRVKAYIIALIDSQWIPEAWSKDRDAIVAGIVCEINASNPGRIDVLVPDIIAVGLRIMAVKYQWAFSAAA
jgi:phage tail sheath gpL-like